MVVVSTFCSVISDDWFILRSTSSVQRYSFTGKGKRLKYLVRRTGEYGWDLFGPYPIVRFLVSKNAPSILVDWSQITNHKVRIWEQCDFCSGSWQSVMVQVYFGTPSALYGISSIRVLRTYMVGRLERRIVRSSRDVRNPTSRPVTQPFFPWTLPWKPVKNRWTEKATPPPKCPGVTGKCCVTEHASHIGWWVAREKRRYFERTWSWLGFDNEQLGGGEDDFLFRSCVFFIQSWLLTLRSFDTLAHQQVNKKQKDKRMNYFGSYPSICWELLSITDDLSYYRDWRTDSFLFH